jgi:hypothetical protein
MFYKFYIPFIRAFYFWWSAAGIPQQLWARPCFWHHREGRLQAGFGQIYALFLGRYTPCFWLNIRPKGVFGKHDV